MVPLMRPSSTHRFTGEQPRFALKHSFANSSRLERIHSSDFQLRVAER
jgi:hypothetical protein